MATFISHSAQETAALGEQWGHKVQAGLVIGLSGDLGAGKTQLVKGLARGLGIGERVQSPTFALVNLYTSGRLPLYHLDLYRLETAEQIRSAGLEQYLETEGVTIVEWAERWFGDSGHAAAVELRGAVKQESSSALGAVPPSPSRPSVPRLAWVRIETLSESDRRIEYADLGA
jgi:tRNA threonylcarbamoyladenosine biosynthesis protein TsaE